MQTEAICGISYSMKKKRRRRGTPKLKLKPEVMLNIVGVLLICIGSLLLISFSGQGKLLIDINQLFTAYFGLASLVIPFVFIVSGLTLFNTKLKFTQPHVLLGGILVLISVLMLFRTGHVGKGVFQNTSQLLSPAGTIVLALTLMVIGILVMSQMKITELSQVFALLKLPKRKPAQEQDEASESAGKRRFSLPKLRLAQAATKRDFSEPETADDSTKQKKEAAPAPAPAEPAKPKVLEPLIPPPPKPAAPSQLPNRALGLSPASQVWRLPPLDLLDKAANVVANRGDVNKNADTIEQTLESFGIRAEVKEVNKGPSVTQYTLEISRGTKLSKVTALSTDLALALAAPTGQIRIEAPIAGRSLVGIEVPNYSAEFVNLRTMLEKPVMKDEKHKKLLVALGIDVANNPVVVDINAMPHMLIAGSTGSGKSVALNSFICSILFRATPQEVNFIFVDPKRVELTGYNDIPHLLTPVIIDTKKVVAALNWATHEMEERYKKMAQVGVKEIKRYNEIAGHAAMSHIVIVIDELADVMLFAPSDVEESVTRLAQMARAVGIHLILATQRPSVDVLTGLIKANIPARIAFNVSSMTDSRVILDTPGAEKLLGKGDMLFIPPDKAKPIRVQGTFVSEDETKRLIAYLKEQGTEPQYIEEVTSKYTSITSGGKTSGMDADGEDELLLDVAKFVVTADKASSSVIQRRFSVGYNRAARILDQLYDLGLVGPQEGSKPRAINPGKLMEYIQAHTSEDDAGTGS